MFNFENKLSRQKSLKDNPNILEVIGKTHPSNRWLHILVISLILVLLIVIILIAVLVSVKNQSNIDINSNNSIYISTKAPINVGKIQSLALLLNSNLASTSLASDKILVLDSNLNLVTTISMNGKYTRCLTVLNNGNLVSATTNLIIIFDDQFQIKRSFQHDDIVNFLKVMQIGYLVSASNDLTIRIWNTELTQNNQIAILKSHTKQVISLEIQQNGNILSGSCDTSIKVWSVKNYDLMYTLYGHFDCVTTISKLLDDNMFASGSIDKRIIIWNNYSQNRTLIDHTLAIFNLALSISGDLISASGDKSIRIWNRTTFVNYNNLTQHTDSVTSLVVSPQNGQFFSGSSDQTIKLWSQVTELNARSSFKISPSGTYRMITLQNGNIAISSLNDNFIRVIDSINFNITGVLNDHKDKVVSLCLIGNDKFASGSFDSTISIWNTYSLELVQKLPVQTTFISALVYLKDSRLVSGSQGFIKLWDTNKFEEQNRILINDLTIWDLVQLPNGQIASASSDNTIKIVDLSKFEIVSLLTGHGGIVYTLTVLNNGNLASGSYDKIIIIWDTSSYKMLKKLTGHNSFVLKLFVLFSGDLVSGGSEKGEIKVWDKTTFNNIESLSGDGSVYGISILKTGELITGLSNGPLLTVWSTRNFKLINSVT